MGGHLNFYKTFMSGVVHPMYFNFCAENLNLKLNCQAEILHGGLLEPFLYFINSWWRPVNVNPKSSRKSLKYLFLLRKRAARETRIDSDLVSVLNPGTNLRINNAC